jgi:thiamine kinase-like enzyme
MQQKPDIILYPSVISKLFDDEKAYLRELDVYKSDLPHVPKLISSGRAEVMGEQYWYITIKRIMGKSYLDQQSFSAGNLALAIAEFHLASMVKDKCLCHIDNQPQNILLAGSDFYFVDFSDSRMDFPEIDISHLLLFWAEEYSYISFIELASGFLGKYQNQIILDSRRWQKSLKSNIKTFDKRRAEHGKSTIPSQARDQNRNWLLQIV